MKTCKEAVDLIKRFEGLRLRAYKCPADVWTIGYGSTLGVQDGMIISAHEAGEFLERDLKRFEGGVTRLCGAVAQPNQFGALVSFAFNLGLGALQRSTLRQKVLRGDHSDVPAEFMKWTRGGGRILPGLVKRRAAEAELYASAQ